MEIAPGITATSFSERVTRAYILERANECVNGDREGDYGSPENSFQTISNLWSDYLAAVLDKQDILLQPKDVAAMLALLKRRFGHLGMAAALPEFLKIVAAALLCAVTCVAMNRALPPAFGTGRVFIRLALCAGTSLIVYGIACFATGVKAIRELTNRTVRRNSPH